VEVIEVEKYVSYRGGQKRKRVGRVRGGV